MKLTDRVRPFLLRWDRLLAILAIAIPLLVTMVAGLFWMVEHGWLVAFIAASIAFGGVAGLIRLIVGWWRRRTPVAETRPPKKLHARINPEWSAREMRAFEVARAFIAEKTKTPQPWEDLVPLSIEVVRLVANASSEKGRGVMDFTIPEALLLVDRVAIRLRANIRDQVPFADSISVGTLQWLWEHREIVRRLKRHGMTAWRVIRAVKALPIAILREIEGAIAEGHASFITGEGTAIIQALLLEEVATAAVDLYSGNLRFSDTELLDMREAAGDEDRARLSTPDMPLRIAVAGQISAGKSSLINALLGSNLAETDVIPTTVASQTYSGELEGVPVMLLDTPGLDGSKRVADAVLDELVGVDLVLWTIRVNRPAREIDRAMIARYRKYFDELPARRSPSIIVVVTCVDEIIPGWPFLENLLSDAAISLVEDAVASVAKDLGDTQTHPVPVALRRPDWNVGTLRARVNSYVGEALMTQRNRLRIKGQTTGVLTEMSRAGRGLKQGLSIFKISAAAKDDTDVR